MSPSSFQLVTGYHEGSYPPPGAYDIGLRERFAVVCATATNADGDMLFDSALFLAVTDAMLRSMRYDSLKIDMDERFQLDSMSKVCSWYDHLEEVDHEPPLLIRLSLNDTIVAVVHVDCWAKVGGPPIYHDSYTISFYTKDNRTVEFRQICEEVAFTHPADLVAFHEGEPRKEPFVAWWKAPLKWLGLKVW